jgi:hypothetical protein
MSAFGDGTAKQRILEECEYVIRDQGLTFAQFVLMLAEILAYLAEYSSSIFIKEK